MLELAQLNWIGACGGSLSHVTRLHWSTQADGSACPNVCLQAWQRAEVA
jgi:hypothetical protein